ncbi:MAG: hypothetical protein A2083_00610 [Gemmatimonadetes bacterium GWC2_71_9]|nr:MAG: hypothetical protein A3I79_07900 [Gemmatimonadetes bacterium RIFCSPLOWO2_02_FULL_71_11]OGT95039.1 MAG: hypothetical protein A2083_00610 [Gemmatimonadetes bacterium GWC2_71_9]
MPFLWRAALAAAVLCTAASPRGAQAQIDYRNLDDDRPTHVEDAYPLERYAFELITPYRVVRGRAGQTVHAFIPEIEYGVLRNAQIGVKLPVAGLDEGGATTWGLSGARLFALYNLNTESRILPALSVRSDLMLPVGSHGGDATRGSVKVLATRSFGRSRLHLNAEYGFGDGATALVEGTDRWWYGAAVDRTLFRRSTLVVAEVYALREADGTPVEVNASVGVRYQWTPTVVLDLGVARGLRSDLGPDFEFTFGLSRAFALPWLMPRGPRVRTQGRF